MLTFLKSNYKANILVLFVIVSEVIYLPFSDINHHEKVSLGIALYTCFSQIGYVSFIPSLFLYHNEQNVDSKGIYLGLIIWNGIEIAQELNSLFKLNIRFLEKTFSLTSDIMQIIFIVTIIILAIISKRKCYT